MFLTYQQIARWPTRFLYFDIRDNPCTTSDSLVATSALPNADSSSFDCLFPAERTSVARVLGNLHLLHLFSEGRAVSAKHSDSQHHGYVRSSEDAAGRWALGAVVRIMSVRLFHTLSRICRSRRLLKKVSALHRYSYLKPKIRTFCALGHCV